jgi:hypothetical protein
MGRKPKEKRRRRNPTCGKKNKGMEKIYVLHFHEGVQFAGAKTRIHTYLFLLASPCQISSNM